MQFCFKQKIFNVFQRYINSFYLTFYKFFFLIWQTAGGVLCDNVPLKVEEDWEKNGKKKYLLEKKILLKAIKKKNHFVLFLMFFSIVSSGRQDAYENCIIYHQKE